MEYLADDSYTPDEALEAKEEFFDTQGLSQGLTLAEFYDYIHS